MTADNLTPLIKFAQLEDLEESTFECELTFLQYDDERNSVTVEVAFTRVAWGIRTTQGRGRYASVLEFDDFNSSARKQ